MIKQKRRADNSISLRMDMDEKISEREISKGFTRYKIE
jgi:hypothetical protein